MTPSGLPSAWPPRSGFDVCGQRCRRCGFRLLYARQFGGWSGASGLDPLLAHETGTHSCLVWDSAME